MNMEKFKLYFKKIGIIGFLFFLAKGLLWLLAGYLVKTNVF